MEWKNLSQSFSLSGPLPESMQHAMNGKHGAFTGRKYRRGEHRCSYCGAPKDASSKTLHEQLTDFLAKELYS